MELEFSKEELEFILDTLEQTEEYGKNGYSYFLQNLISKFYTIKLEKLEELEYQKFKEYQDRYKKEINRKLI